MEGGGGGGGGDFNNESSRNAVELLGIKTATTAAESLWSNCIVEWHNSVIEQIILPIEPCLLKLFCTVTKVSVPIN